MKELLVDPLPIESTLVASIIFILIYFFKVLIGSGQAIFDSCHSCSLLGMGFEFFFVHSWLYHPSDLEHCRCNRVYVPWLNKGQRKTDFHRNIISKRYPLYPESWNLNFIPKCGIMPVRSILYWTYFFRTYLLIRNISSVCYTS